MRYLAGVLLLSVACGGRTEWRGDPELCGVLLSVEDGANAYTAAPDFRFRVKHVLEASARFYGRDPAELSGVRIIFGAHGTDCGVARNWMGCYTEETNMIFVTTDPAWTMAVEQTQLPHEMLHYFIGDPHHATAIWRELGPLWDALNPTIRYAGQWD